MKEKLLISFSGGRTSAYMTWFILNQWKQRHKYEIVVVFANTGKEREETLQFVNRCDIEFGFNTVWVEAFVHYKKNSGTTHKVVNFKTANRDGKPFEDVIKKYGIPNPAAKHCSREMKGQAIKSYARSIGWVKSDYKTALGIRTDEPARLDWEKKEKENLLYFAEIMTVKKNDINHFWNKQAFDLELKSYEGNCDLCWKKSKRKLMTIVQDNPEFAGWWREMEEKYQMFTPETRKGEAKPPYRFFREHMTIDEIIEESKFPFLPAKDESKILSLQEIPLWEDHLDGNAGCVESCEAF